MAQIKRLRKSAAMLLCFGFIVTGAPVFLSADEAHSADPVQVTKIENRTQAVINSPADGVSKDSPNIVNRSVSAVAHGTYFSVKAVVDTIGKGMDYSVSAVQTGGRKIYDLLTPRCLKKTNSQ
ncbi:MAG TPA: hypothetical protein PKL97_03855 [Candidatus Omnitrophota bacterium]|nr:hypothetical protein [Candidatus Omnitrophota bacterium]